MSLFSSLKAMLNLGPQVDLAAAFARVRSGEAVLVDVREAGEWTSGVAQGAALLPLSDLHGPRKAWKKFLTNNAHRELLVYCASGMRSGRVAQILSREGLRASNVGGIGHVAAGGWPIVPPS